MTIRNFISRLFNFLQPKQPVKASEPKPSAPSTSIIVSFGDKPVGAIQSTSISESRCEEMQSVTVTGIAHRVRLDKQRVAEAFSRGMVTVQTQRYPLQITIKTDGHPTTEIQNVWLTGVDWAYLVGDWIILDEMKWEAELIKTKNS